MDKITDFKGISKYYCYECEYFHRKKYKYIIDKDGKRIKTKDTPFFNHKEFAYKLTSSELWKKQFKKSWNRYDLNEVLKKAKQ